MPTKLIYVSGARPNFVKLAPLLRQLDQDPRFAPVLVHTGQHYDEKMSGQFFRDLAIRSPERFLQVGSGSHAVQTAEIMKRIEPVKRQNPDSAMPSDANTTGGRCSC